MGILANNKKDINKDKPKPKILNKKRFYYHVTKKNMPPIWEMKPLSSGEQRDEKEPKISRICVGPDVAHCLSAIPIFPEAHHIYKTEEKVKSWYPCGVVDSWLTEEMWLRRPTVFMRIGTIREDVMNVLMRMTTDNYQYGEPYEDRQRQKEFIALANMLFDADGVLSLPCNRRE